ncbi:unnamed protein product [Amoebophrya sp. A25]|nr:unnamed protein product [Amoebophrya sp. A25]|eukprot:GSA25T00009171001.1
MPPSRSSRNSSSVDGRISNTAYYANYHGHQVQHLVRTKTLLTELYWPERQSREDPRPGDKKGGFIYLLGDSTLDNKHWLYSNVSMKDIPDTLVRDGLPACNGYEQILSRPQRSIPDVAYWLNRAIADSSRASPSRRSSDSSAPLPHYIAVNAAVEESTLGQRRRGLLPHDKFVADAFGKEDILLFSCGGNDIALAPGLSTIINIASAVFCASLFGSREDGYTPGLTHFAELFGKQTKDFIQNVVWSSGGEGGGCSTIKPKLIVVCMLYFLDEDSSQYSWANATLSFLRYNIDPTMLQNFIRYCFKEGTKNIRVNTSRDTPNDPATEIPVLAVPLFETLDGKDTRDYVARVEPSVAGGKKLGYALWKVIQEKLKEIDGETPNIN